MIEEPEPPESPENPLAGVLDRLLRREHDPVAVSPKGNGGTRTGPAREPSPSWSETSSRRMLAVAGLAGVGESPVLRCAAQWAAVLGRRPSITDLSCPEGGPGGLEDPDARVAAGDACVPRASVPCGPERIRREPADTALALLHRLRRHEASSDLVIVGIPARERPALMRAAFLAGAIVVPVGESEAALDEALEITREVLQSFHEVTVWPFSTSGVAMERYMRMAREHDAARVLPFDPGHRDLAAAFEELREPPPEGFLVGLLAPEPATLSEELLRFDSIGI